MKSAPDKYTTLLFLISVFIDVLCGQEIYFSSTPLEEKSFLGAQVLLQCKAHVRPRVEEPLKITWKFKGQTIYTDSKYTLLPNGLNISKLDLRDPGRYECLVELESLSISNKRIINLDILYPPVIRKAPVTILPTKGHNVTLTCIADGNPPVKYEWLKEQQISEMFRVKAKLDSSTNFYTIVNLSSEHEGRYYCKVSNEFGFKEAFVEVQMLVPPVIKLKQSRLVVSEHSQVNISCEASGVPLPKISWKTLPGHQFEDPYWRHSGYVMEQAHPGMNTLILKQVKRTQTGNAICTAENLVGSTSANFSLIIEYKPTLQVDRRELLSWRGETRSFECRATGLPSPTISWSRDASISIPSDQRIYNIQVTRPQQDTIVSLLTITADESDSVYGVYSCVAKNIYGYASEKLHLTKALPPETPRNVSVVEESTNSVILKAMPPTFPFPDNINYPVHGNHGYNVTIINHPAHLPLLSWMVAYHPVEFAHHRIERIFKIDDQIFIDGLREGESYVMYVSVSNAVGYSQPIKFQINMPHRKISKDQQSDFPIFEKEVKLDPPQSNPKSQTRIISTLQIVVEFFSSGSGFIYAVAGGCLLVLTSVTVAVICGLASQRNRLKQQPRYTNNLNNKNIKPDSNREPLNHYCTDYKIENEGKIEGLGTLQRSTLSGNVSLCSPKPQRSVVNSACVSPVFSRELKSQESARASPCRRDLTSNQQKTPILTPSRNSAFHPVQKQRSVDYGISPQHQTMPMRPALQHQRSLDDVLTLPTRHYNNHCHQKPINCVAPNLVAITDPSGLPPPPYEFLQEARSMDINSVKSRSMVTNGYNRGNQVVGVVRPVKEEDENSRKSLVMDAGYHRCDSVDDVIDSFAASPNIFNGLT